MGIKLFQADEIEELPFNMWAEVHTYSTVEAMRLIQRAVIDSRHMRADQQKLPINYTESLHSGRKNYFSEFQASLTDRIGKLIGANSTVIEYGPGVEKSLYRLLIPNSQRAAAWYGVDINKNIVVTLEAENQDTNFHPVLSAAHRKSIPVSRGSADIALFMCSHDSMMEFNEISKNVDFYLRERGYVGLIQDHYPSISTLLSLIAHDPSYEPNLPVFLIYSREPGDKDPYLAFVGVPKKEGKEFGGVYFMDSRHYLNDRVKNFFVRRGFEVLSNGLVNLCEGSQNQSALSQFLYERGMGHQISIDRQEGIDYAFTLLHKKISARKPFFSF